MKSGSKYFITAIDTDAGKTVATGLAARYLISKGKKVITQKIAQTGCTGMSDDISVHREIMGSGLLSEDREGLTCQYLFSFPASPHLSASIAGTVIDMDNIAAASEKLAERYDYLLAEGVGGLMVPLNERDMVIDYISLVGYPVIIVSNAKLGSLNHSLLTLEVCKSRGVDVAGVIYNTHIATNPLITADTQKVLQEALARYYPCAGFVIIPQWKKGEESPDFYPIFGV